MEGIPAPDLADYKRRKELELGLVPGTISQPPPAKKAKIENKPLSEAELRAQLEAHKALMGGNEDANKPAPSTNGGAMYAAAPTAYPMPPMPNGMSLPPGLPPFGMPPMPGGPFPPPFPGAQPFPGMPGMFPGG